MNRFATAACVPKNVPRYSGGMIFEIMLVHGLAVKPPPSPCQVSRMNVSDQACLQTYGGRSNATMAKPRNGSRSWMVLSNTVFLYLRKRAT
jgi:hypothetical protein